MPFENLELFRLGRTLIFRMRSSHVTHGRNFILNASDPRNFFRKITYTYVPNYSSIFRLRKNPNPVSKVEEKPDGAKGPEMTNYSLRLQNTNILFNFGYGVGVFVQRKMGSEIGSYN